MSRRREEAELGLIFFEKITGIILLITGIILSSLTYIGREELGGAPAVFLIAVGVVLALLGLLALIARGE